MHGNRIKMGSVVFALCAALAACTTPVYRATDRGVGERAPITSACDALDESLCLLPYPSNRFARLDPNTATGLRLAVDIREFGPGSDDATFLRRADGFSRVSPIVFGIRGLVGELAAEDTFLTAADPREADFAIRIPTRIEIVAPDEGSDLSLVILYPQAVLAPNRDYVAGLLRASTASGGAGILETSAPRAVQIAVGAASADSQAEANAAGYHAPTRAVIAKLGVAPNRIVRLTDFTTRSAQDPTRRLLAMRASVKAATRRGDVTVKVDSARVSNSGATALTVSGHFDGIPDYLKADGTLNLDAADMPVQTGTRSAPFRVMVPVGTGDYPIVLFGHGAGGTVDDSSFDSELAAAKFGKANYQFDPWSGETILATIAGFRAMFRGVDRSTSQSLQALANGAALDEALAGKLGDALAATQIAGIDNPTKGRRPDMQVRFWGGGSMGGIMGFVVTAAAPEIRYAALNVPGAAWTHFLPQSAFYIQVRDFIRTSYGGMPESRLALAMSQSGWDDVDGAVWADAGAFPGRIAPTYLIQESVGDPIVPNNGTSMLARAAKAAFVGAVLRDIPNLERAAMAEGKSAITQFKVRSDQADEVHGFANSSSSAGAAARSQIADFLSSAASGNARISVPVQCKNASCDFSAQ